MKNTTFSLEGIALIVLLIAGLFGARLVLQQPGESSERVIPQQETSSMVMAPEQPIGTDVWAGSN